MKLNNKGFAISTIMYLILVVGVIITVMILSSLNSSKLLIEKQKNKATDYIYSSIYLNYISNTTQTVCDSKKIVYHYEYGDLCTATKNNYTFNGWYNYVNLLENAFNETFNNNDIVIINSKEYYESDYIPVTSGDILYLNKNIQAIFYSYDLNKQKKSESTNFYLEVGSNIKYIKIYIPKNNYNTSLILANNVIFVDDFLIQGEINVTNGSYSSTSSGYKATEVYFQVKSNTTLILSKTICGIYSYDSGKGYLGRILNRTNKVTTSSNVKYIRFEINNSENDTSTQLTAFTSSKITSSTINNINNNQIAYGMWCKTTIPITNGQKELTSSNNDSGKCVYDIKCNNSVSITNGTKIYTKSGSSCIENIKCNSSVSIANGTKSYTKSGSSCVENITCDDGYILSDSSCISACNNTTENITGGTRTLDCNGNIVSIACTDEKYESNGSSCQCKSNYKDINGTCTAPYFDNCTINNNCMFCTTYTGKGTYKYVDVTWIQYKYNGTTYVKDGIHYYNDNNDTSAVISSGENGLIICGGSSVIKKLTFGGFSPKCNFVLSMNGIGGVYCADKDGNEDTDLESKICPNCTIKKTDTAMDFDS